MAVTSRRRVVIDDKPKNKHRKQERQFDPSELGIVRPSYESHTLAPPTGDARHIGWIREGRLPGDVFSKRRLATILVDHDVRSDQRAEAQTVKRTPTDNTKQSSAEVRVRGAGEKRQGSKKGGSKSRQKGKGVQAASRSKAPQGAVADAVRRARERKSEIK